MAPNLSQNELAPLITLLLVALTIDKEYAQKLKEKILVFERETATKKKVSLVLVTTIGLNKNSWSEDLIDQVVTLDDLFDITE